MKIYTSYFGNASKLGKAGVRMISVARYQPRFLPNIPKLLNVAPTPFMLSDRCSEELYLKMYDNILFHLKAEDVMREIEMLAKGSDVALCCYEKPTDFCHRHILAKWLTEQTRVEVKEFEEKKMIELDLFG